MKSYFFKYLMDDLWENLQESLNLQNAGPHSRTQKGHLQVGRVRGRPYLRYFRRVRSFEVGAHWFFLSSNSSLRIWCFRRSEKGRRFLYENLPALSRTYYWTEDQISFGQQIVSAIAHHCFHTNWRLLLCDSSTSYLLLEFSNSLAWKNALIVETRWFGIKKLKRDTFSSPKRSERPNLDRRYIQ